MVIHENCTVADLRYARGWVGRAVSGMLIFIQPSNDPTFKMVWLVIAYNLYYAVAFPLYNTANSTLTPLSTRNGKQRSVLASLVNMSLLGATGAGSMIFPILLGLLISDDMSLGEQKNYWLVLFIIVAVITFFGTILQYYFTRERVTEERASVVQKEGKKGASVREQAKCVVNDKFFWIIIIFYFLYQFSGGIKNTSMNFYAENLVTGGLNADYIPLSCMHRHEEECVPCKGAAFCRAEEARKFF